MTLECAVQKLHTSAYTPADPYVNNYINGMTIDQISQWSTFDSLLTSLIPEARNNQVTDDTYVFYSKKNDGTDSTYDGARKTITTQLIFPA